MRCFHVIARTEGATYSYDAVAASSFDAFNAAVDRFGACKISVRPA